MSLKKILSITGRSGLFKIIGQSRNMIVVEDLVSGRRFPANMRDKIVSLGDISMYTDSGDKPLGEILERLRVKEDGKTVDLKALIENDGLRAKFEEIVPDFDRDRVYNSDLKKFFSWYNLLVEKGITDFVDAEEKKEEKKDKEEEKKEAE